MRKPSMKKFALAWASGDPMLMTKKQKAYRDEYLEMGIAERGAHWCANHKAALFAFCFCIAATIWIALKPQEAEALPILVPVAIALGTLAAAVVPTAAIEGAAEWLADAIRTLDNTLFGLDGTLINNACNSKLLDGSFAGMFDGASGSRDRGVAWWLHNIQNEYIIPLAMLILAIFFCIALGKLLSDAGKNDNGINLWQICWVFIAFAGTAVIIQNSWEAMQFAYDIVASYISGISKEVSALSGVATVPDSVVNIGVLLSLALVAIVSMFIALIVYFIVQASMMVRGLQIYTYTTLAPLSLATLTSDSARPMATGFLKRWMATLLAGLIMIVLLGCFQMILSSTGDLAIPPLDDTTDIDKIIRWTCDIFATFALYIALAFCMLQSGSWAREMVGV